MPVNKFTPLAINPNRRISCAEISKSKNSEKHVVYVILLNFGSYRFAQKLEELSLRLGVKADTTMRGVSSID